MSGLSTVDQQTSQKIIEILDTATVENNTFIKLEHPGQIFYLDHTKDSKIYGIFQTPKKFFAKMLLRKEMINNHFGGAYEKAFANVELGKYFFPTQNIQTKIFGKEKIFENVFSLSYGCR